METETKNKEVVKEAFELFYPGQGQPPYTVYSYDLATIMLHLATEKSRNMQIALNLLKQVVKLNPTNAASWLMKLPLKLLIDAWRHEGEFKKIVVLVLAHKFEIFYFQLLNKDHSGVHEYLSPYNSVLGTTY